MDRFKILIHRKALFQLACDAIALKIRPKFISVNAGTFYALTGTGKVGTISLCHICKL